MYQLPKSENVSTDVDMETEVSKNQIQWQQKQANEPVPPCYAAEGLCQLSAASGQHRTPRKIKISTSASTAAQSGQVTPRSTEDASALAEDLRNSQAVSKAAVNKCDKRTLRKRTTKGYATQLAHMTAETTF